MLFSQVIGQHEVKSRLRKSFHDGRLAHALLLHGPEGCGNLALAVAFAQYIACAQRTNTDSCGQCNICKKFETLQFADLHFSFPFFNKPKGEITRSGGDLANDKTICDDYARDWREFLLAETPYSNLDSWRKKIEADNKQLHVSVYEAQSIIHKLSLKSYEGGYKFMVLWHADFMKPETANKLLKIVEEPPDRTLFLFVAGSIENILPTILSRVQTLHVPKIDDQAMRSALMAAGAEEEKANGIAHYADGNWHYATQLLQSEDPNALFSEQFQQWMRWCFKRDVLKLVKWSDQMHTQKRDDQKYFLRYALEQLRHNLVLNYAGDELVRMNAVEMGFSQKFARFINHLNIEELYSEISKAHDDIGRNAYSKMVLLDLSFRVHHLLQRTEDGQQ